jgi:hypothetical protein
MNGMKVTKLFCILFSALLYSLAFIIPEICYGAIFMFMIPIWYAYYQNGSLSFFDGFVWGVGAFGISLYGIWLLLYEHASAMWGLGASLFLLIYISCCAGLWFYIAFGSDGIRLNIYSIVLSSGISSLFWWWFSTQSLWIFGVRAGCWISFPLVPLIKIPLLLYALPAAGPVVLVWLLMNGTAFLVFAVVYKRWYFAKAAGFCFIPFIYGFFCQLAPHESPPWLQKVICILPHKQLRSAYEQAEHIAQAFAKIRIEYSYKKIVFIPESGFCYPFNEHPWALTMWAENGMAADMFVVLGSYRKDGLVLFNTMVTLQEHRIINYYDKKCLVPFFEKTFGFWTYIKNPFNMGLEFTSSNCPYRYCIAHNDMPLLCGYICSELFFENVPPLKDVVCIANDSWFSASYMQKLLLGVIRFKALMWKKAILYISHKYALYIDRSGYTEKISIA